MRRGHLVEGEEREMAGALGRGGDDGSFGCKGSSVGGARCVEEKLD